MFNRFTLFGALGCLVLLCSCGKNATRAERDRIKQAHLELNKHFDIPVPLSFTLAETTTKKLAHGYSDFFNYVGPLPVTKAIAFYKQEMERAGWDISDLSTEHEGFLYCSKPTKQCGIQIRPTGKPHMAKITAVSLFISPNA